MLNLIRYFSLITQFFASCASMLVFGAPKQDPRRATSAGKVPIGYPSRVKCAGLKIWSPLRPWLQLTCEIASGRRLELIGPVPTSWLKPLDTPLTEAPETPPV